MSKKHCKEIIEAFSNASRHYSDASILMHEAIARKVGLPGTDHKYLGLILQHRELTAGAIARLTGLTTGAVTGLIDRLEKKKLVKRKFSKEDRRKVMIVPNEENAVRLLGPIFGALTQRTAKLLSGYSEEEVKVILRYFTEATTLMKEVTDSLNNP